MEHAIYVGNAETDAPGNRGWLLGYFRPTDDARHSEDVEVKWAVHPQGDQRPQWVAGEKRSALALLISGRFRIELPGRTVLLAQQGDYVVFHGLSHSWYAEEASVVVFIRWPSVSGYAAADQEPQNVDALPGMTKIVSETATGLALPRSSSCAKGLPG